VKGATEVGGLTKGVAAVLTLPYPSPNQLVMVWSQVRGNGSVFHIVRRDATPEFSQPFQWLEQRVRYRASRRDA